MTLICFAYVCVQLMLYLHITRRRGSTVYIHFGEAFGDACFLMDSRQVLTPLLFLFNQMLNSEGLQARKEKMTGHRTSLVTCRSILGYFAIYPRILGRLLLDTFERVLDCLFFQYVSAHGKRRFTQGIRNDKLQKSALICVLKQKHIYKLIRMGHIQQ